MRVAAAAEGPGSGRAPSSCGRGGGVQRSLGPTGGARAGMVTVSVVGPPAGGLGT